MVPIDRIFGMMITVCCVRALSGCSVMENREPCPCYLDLDYSEVLAEWPSDGPSGKIEVGVYRLSSDYSSVYLLSDCPSSEEKAVTRGMAEVVGVVHNRPARFLLSDGTRIRWAAGHQIDSVYGHHSTVDCTGEEARCLLELHKQFHTVRISDGFDGAMLHAYKLVVQGTTSGFDESDFSAIEGDYGFTVPEQEGVTSFRIPRQLRDDLLLKCLRPEDDAVAFTFPLGRYLAATGYDKSALDLCDFDLKIDFRRSVAYIRIAGWIDEWMVSLYE